MIDFVHYTGISDGYSPEIHFLGIHGHRVYTSQNHLVAYCFETINTYWLLIKHCTNLGFQARISLEGPPDRGCDRRSS